MSKNIKINAKDLEESQIKEEYMGRFDTSSKMSDLEETMLIDPYTREVIKLTGRRNKVETRIMHCDLVTEPTKTTNPLEKLFISDLMKNVSLENKPYSIQRGYAKDRTTGSIKSGGIITGRPGIEIDIQSHETVLLKHPTRTMLENSLALLEDSKFAITFPSGTSALNAVASLCESGDHVIVLDEVYSSTASFFNNCMTRMCVNVTFVDLTDLEVASKAIQPNTSMIWIESPNSSLKIVDIKAVVEIVREISPDCLIVVDSTLATPLLQRPLELGADIVLHSLSKFINGHMDCVLGGLLMNQKDIYERLLRLQESMGLQPSIFDCFLLNRSIKTFPMRIREQSKSAMKIANFLATHPAILPRTLVYPGHMSYPQAALFKEQMKGNGCVILFGLNTKLADPQIFVDSLKLFLICDDTIGSYVSLVTRPEIPSTGVEPELYFSGQTEANQIRLSIGLEDCDDLINDLIIAFEKCSGKRV